APNDVHILLVDDERLSRVVVGNLLRKCSYKVTEAGSGMEALEILRGQPPGTFSLILTDVMMPDVDGIELLRHVRGDEAWSNLPVIMMSANERTETVFECIRGGAEDYLLKPVTKKEVQHMWQHVWRRQQ
ncbi:CheY-like protein, partial [Coccomyxa subellipsoidea C-169]